MTGEIVYADLNVPSEWPCLRPPQASQHLDLPLQPRWQRVALWVGWVTNVILGAAVIALGIWDGSGCKLCPATWLLHRDKCYWVSGKMKSWNESRDDCSAKHSQLLVIRDWEEMEFIKNTTQGSTFVWIGLSLSSRAKTWIWLNGSQLNQTLLMTKEDQKRVVDINYSPIEME